MKFQTKILNVPRRLYELNRIYKKEQFSYGHREILLKYINADESQIINGRLQHGVWPSHWEESYLTNLSWSGFAPYYVFSKVREKEAYTRNLKHVISIGAPWYYMKVNEPAVRKKVRKFLIMPDHSTVNFIDESNFEQKIKRAKEFRKIIGEDSATICLYFNDFLDTQTREAFESQGFEVTCVGVGGNSTYWSTAGGRINFLPNLMKLMLEHEFFLTETLNTSLMYAIDLKLKVGIFPSLKKNLKLGVNGRVSSKDLTLEDHRRCIAYLEKTDLKLSINNFYFTSNYDEFVEEFLGISSVLQPDELKSILKLKSHFPYKN